VPHNEETGTARTIRLPRDLWEALDTDAKRCKRTSIKQLEALLTQWYTADNVELQFKPEVSAQKSAPRRKTTRMDNIGQIHR
jgi:hypothetical protein